MTDTDTLPLASGDTADAPAKGTRRRSGSGLSGMVLAELQQVAGGLGIKGTGRMRKGQLIEAIQTAQNGGSGGTSSASSAAAAPAAPAPAGSEGEAPARRTTRRRATSASASSATNDDQASVPATVVQAPAETPQQSAPAEAAPEARESSRSDNRDSGNRESNRSDSGRSEGDRDSGNRDSGTRSDSNRDSNRDSGRNDGNRSDGGNRDSNRSDGGNRDGNRSDGGNRDSNRNDGGNRDSNRSDGRTDNRNDNRSDGNRDDESGGRRRRRNRNRDRDRGPDRGSDRGRNDRSSRNEIDTTVNEDDVLLPVAGIIDILDNYAFVRTSGYLPGSGDVYVSLSMVRKAGLRKGDAVTGQVRQAREADRGNDTRKDKFNPLVRLDTVNGMDIEESRKRLDFAKLTPLYAQERLRLEHDAATLTTRIIDIVAPIGKGQRGLIVSPPKAGKTMVLQSIANAITTNNPECHLMVVLVDERPEEVTDMQRTVKGEVIASTFDRPATDHTTVAELAIERAKRLVEMGHDVVVLLDSIPRLGRAYNIAAPASGRILSGGVDSSALYPPKRFFGAARNIEHGGSLTILATALIETGSRMDEVIFEEFKGTGNMELRLRREFADKRIFPAIDVDSSGTRREELLLSREELAVVWKLRRVLSALDGQQALELMIEKLKKTASNVEFLMQVQKTTPMAVSGRNDD